MNYYFEAWRKYADFSGRARRREYWYFISTNCLIFICGILLFYSTTNVFIRSFLVWIFSFFLVLIIIPSLAVTVRRIHDTGHSGLWYFLPMPSSLFDFWMLSDSQPGDNKYGSNPKGGIKTDANSFRQKTLFGIRIPLGIVLIMIVLSFAIMSLLFNFLQEISLYKFSLSGVYGYLERLFRIICYSLIVFGFWKKLAWSRILFILATAYLLMQEFISLAIAIKSPEFDREPIGTSIVMGFGLLSIVFLVWTIVYVYRKKSYFVNK